VAKVAQSATAA